MEGFLMNARVPTIQLGALDRRCQSLGLITPEMLGVGISRYVVINPVRTHADALNQRLFDLKLSRRSLTTMTVPTASLDHFITIRREYSSESIGESALISLALDSLDQLRDDQLRRIYDTFRSTCILLGDIS